MGCFLFGFVLANISCSPDEPTGRREAPPDDRLRDMREQHDKRPQLPRISLRSSGLRSLTVGGKQCAPSRNSGISGVMPGFMPGIHVFFIPGQDVDGRDKPGHDGARTAGVAMTMKVSL
jgi:hypothetical protein